MNKRITTQQIVGTGLLLALEILFQIIGNYLQFGEVNINITLVTIVLGAVMYGPLSGAVLGFFNGVVTLFSPSTLALFMTVSPLGTIIACLFKCTIAGLVAGFVFKALKNKNLILALVVSGLTVPIINTGIFAVCALLFFRPILERFQGDFPNIYAFLIIGFIGINFIFEVVVTPLLSTLLGTIVLKRRQTA